MDTERLRQWPQGDLVDTEDSDSGHRATKVVATGRSRQSPHIDSASGHRKTQLVDTGRLRQWPQGN